MQKHLTQSLQHCVKIADNLVPKPSGVFKAFRMTPLDDVKAVIISDYPVNNSSGLAFGTTTYSDYSGKVADRLIRDFGEENFLDMPLGEPVEYQYDPTLESWAKQGVLLLNASLTISNSPREIHTEIWREFMEEVIKNITQVRTGIVFLLIGEEAESLRPCIKGTFNYILRCEHPRDAIRDNRPWECNEFQVINEILKQNYNYEIRWLK